MQRQHERTGERGNLLLVVVFLASAIAGLAALQSGRLVSEIRQQSTLEHETRAFNGAYAQIHMAMNVINTSAYNERNQNLALRDAVVGVNGGTVKDAADKTWRKAGETVSAVESATASAIETAAKTETETKATVETRAGKLAGGEKTGYTFDGATEDIGDWLDQPGDPAYGFVGGTNVRVYRGRDYIQRLQRLRGEPVTEVDPFGDSDSYFILEAAGRSGDTIRLVAALVRENEPFSSFVFFQNQATLGVSGSPRGLVHSNRKIDFYFPNGNYVDSVTAVEGFGYMAGANTENTNLRNGNPEANPINLDAIDFDDLRAQAELYVGEEGLDAEIKLYSNGKVRIRPHTPPRYDKVEKSYTYKKYVGTETVTTTEKQNVKVGTKTVPYEVDEIDYYKTETYTVKENVKVGTKDETYTVPKKVKVGEKTETKYKDVTVQTSTKKVKKYKDEPVYEEKTVTKYKKVKVWVPYDTGGTSVGGGDEGSALGEWQWQDQPYQTTEMVQVGTNTVEYWVDEPVYTTTQESYEVTTPIYEWQDVEKTKTVDVYELQDVEKTTKTPVYKKVTKYKDEPIYEEQDVEVTKTVKKYEDVTYTYTSWEYNKPTYMSSEFRTLGEDGAGTVYVDGRITRLYGNLNGRLTIVGNEKVRVTGNVRYVDGDGNKAMKNGSDYSEPYERNSDYAGHSVLGVIAREDIVFTRQMPSSGEFNGTLMSVNGRVGIDGFWADETGELHADSWSTRSKYMTEEEYVKEYAYDRVGNYRTKRFRKDSLRRMGGVISNNRIMDTYIKTGKDGYAYVDAGFKRGVMKFDINLLFNPPPNFVEVPRPVLTSYVPIVLVRNDG